MAEVYDCSDSSQLLTGTRVARQALGRGDLAVLPTDTVYGVAADAFTPAAVKRLLEAKGRGRQSPPPVLIPNTGTLAALAAEVPPAVDRLAEAFWPGALTVVLKANPSLSWDLGDTGGTVALRIPDHALTRELLQETGPLAVSSANKTGEPAATTAAEAQEMLGDSIAVYLEVGRVEGDGTASTIVDATRLDADGGGVLRILRDGGVSREAIAELLPEVTITDLETDPIVDPPAESGDPAGAAADAGTEADDGTAGRAGSRTSNEAAETAGTAEIADSGDPQPVASSEPAAPAESAAPTESGEPATTAPAAPADPAGSADPAAPAAPAAPARRKPVGLIDPAELDTPVDLTEPSGTAGAGAEGDAKGTAED